MQGPATAGTNCHSDFTSYYYNLFLIHYPLNSDPSRHSDACAVQCSAEIVDCLVNIRSAFNKQALGGGPVDSRFSEDYNCYVLPRFDAKSSIAKIRDVLVKFDALDGPDGTSSQDLALTRRGKGSLLSTLQVWCYRFLLFLSSLCSTDTSATLYVFRNEGSPSIYGAPFLQGHRRNCEVKCFYGPWNHFRF